MITIDGVLDNLESLVGNELDEDDIICAFEDFEENGESEVYVGKSHNNGYDYIAYINTDESTQFLIFTEKIFDEKAGCLEKEIIKSVKVA